MIKKIIWLGKWIYLVYNKSWLGHKRIWLVKKEADSGKEADYEKRILLRGAIKNKWNTRIWLKCKESDSEELDYVLNINIYYIYLYILQTINSFF